MIEIGTGTWLEIDGEQYEVISLPGNGLVEIRGRKHLQDQPWEKAGFPHIGSSLISLSLLTGTDDAYIDELEDFQRDQELM